MTKLIASFELTNSYFNQFSEHLSFVTFFRRKRRMTRNGTKTVHELDKKVQSFKQSFPNPKCDELLIGLLR